MKQMNTERKTDRSLKALLTDRTPRDFDGNPLTLDKHVVAPLTNSADSIDEDSGETVVDQFNFMSTKGGGS
jgi:hypothetical protein